MVKLPTTTFSPLMLMAVKNSRYHVTIRSGEVDGLDYSYGQCFIDNPDKLHSDAFC